jgi:hypothetical protein
MTTESREQQNELRPVLLEELHRTGESFGKDELAYLALTSKVEFQVRDKLAYRLHCRLGETFVVAREWKRRDLAILKEGRPVLVLELKASYSYSAAKDPSERSEYFVRLQNDLDKARSTLGDGPEIYALLLVTHPMGEIDGAYRDVVKYLRGITGAVKKLRSAEAVRNASSDALSALFHCIAPVERGEWNGGSAFGTSVAIDYWLVGPT